MKNRVNQGLAYKNAHMYKWLYFYYNFLLCIQFDVLILLAPVVKTGSKHPILPKPILNI